jgi:hypothetical protein
MSRAYRGLTVPVSEGVHPLAKVCAMPSEALGPAGELCTRRSGSPV